MQRSYINFDQIFTYNLHILMWVLYHIITKKRKIRSIRLHKYRSRDLLREQKKILEILKFFQEITKIVIKLVNYYKKKIYHI